MALIKVDLHSHTEVSEDCLMSYEEILETCRRRGLGVLASTDHNTLEGALELRARAERTGAPLRVIAGSEVRTTHGDLIGLFLQEPVPEGLSPEDTAAAIREQGGVVYLPHPFDRLRRSAAVRFDPRLERFAPVVDVVEGLNARCLFDGDNLRARRWAEGRRLPLGAGSDAHTPGELGRAYLEMPQFEGPQEFLRALERSRIRGTTSGPLVHVATTLAKLRRRL